MVRAFLSIDLPASLHQLLSQVQASLKQSGADVRWVAVGNIHLTLKFFGNIPEAAVETIGASARAVTREVQPFELRVRELGAFPGVSRPRVVWLGLEEPSGALAHLHQRLEAAFHALGYPSEDRAFNPHLTLGRVRSNQGRDRLSRMLSQVEVPKFPPVCVTGLTLFRSTLTPQGSIYTPLQVIALGSGG